MLQSLMPRRAWSRLTLIVIAPLVFFWLLLYQCGYPSPDWDDLALIGAAMNLARGGELVNPLLAGWVEQTADRFLIQPPFHSYILAGWLTVAGISTQSLLAFQCLCYLCFSIFTALILRAYRYPMWTSFAVTLAFAFWMSGRGLRHDALSMAFLAVGTWCLVRDRPRRYFWGFMAFGSALLTLPLNAVYGSAFGLVFVTCNVWQYKQHQRLTASYIVPRLLALLSAIALSFSLMLVYIDFRLGQFLADLAWHAAWRRAPIGVLPTLQALLMNGYGEITYGSLYALYIVLLLLLWYHWRATSPALKIHSLTLIAALAANLFVYVGTVHQQFNFICWIAVILLLAKLPLARRLRRILLALALIVLLLNYSSPAIALVAQVRQADTTQATAIRQYVRQHPDKTYVIDSITARFAFNYQLPPGALSWEFLNRQDSDPATANPLSQKAADEVWLIASKQAWHVPALPDYPRATLLGRTFESIPKYPYRLQLVE